MFTYKPEVFVLPESAEHVVKLVQLANQEQIPLCLVEQEQA
jgi:FAD/FMN-containing dehydrogenase